MSSRVNFYGEVRLADGNIIKSTNSREIAQPIPVEIWMDEAGMINVLRRSYEPYVVYNYDDKIYGDTDKLNPVIGAARGKAPDLDREDWSTIMKMAERANSTPINGRYILDLSRKGVETFLEEEKKRALAKAIKMLGHFNKDELLQLQEALVAALSAKEHESGGIAQRIISSKGLPDNRSARRS